MVGYEGVEGAAQARYLTFVVGQPRQALLFTQAGEVGTLAGSLHLLDWPLALGGYAGVVALLDKAV